MNRWLLLVLLPSLGCLSGGVQSSRPAGSDDTPLAVVPAVREPTPQQPPQTARQQIAQQPPPEDPGPRPQIVYDGPSQAQDDGELAPPQPPPNDVLVEAPQEADTAEAIYQAPAYDSSPVVATQYAPPPMRYEPPPPMPDEGQTWVGGYWVWGSGDWRWATGHWVSPRAGYYWVPPYYEVRGNGIIFVNGHFLRNGAYFYPPPPNYRMVYGPVPAGYHGYLVPAGYRGVFVPAPPGSRYGLLVPAPIGTTPHVVVGQPPIVRSGMVIRGPAVRGSGSVIVYAPAGVTRGGEVVRSGVPRRPDLAAALPPRVMVAPPRPSAQVLAQHQNAVSPSVVHPVAAGQRYVLPPSARAAYQHQIEVHEQRVQQRSQPAQPQAQARPAQQQSAQRPQFQSRESQAQPRPQFQRPQFQASPGFQSSRPQFQSSPGRTSQSQPGSIRSGGGPASVSRPSPARPQQSSPPPPPPQQHSSPPPAHHSEHRK